MYGDDVAAFVNRPGDPFGGLLYSDGCDGCYRKTPRIAGNLQGQPIRTKNANGTEQENAIDTEYLSSSVCSLIY